MKIIDMRSDTVTKPTSAMRKAMAEAPVGDDVYGEDPTVNALEKLGAEILGKEATLFIPSGTMGNQVAALTHTTPGQEIITEASSHIFLFEAGGLARLGGLQTHILPGERGLFSPESLMKAIRTPNIHFPPTGLVTFENTHNQAGGRVLKPADYKPHIDVCRQYGIPIHLDGARLFNAAEALKLPPCELAAGFDSVSVCLSKGLGAPVGSLLGGSKEFIDKARRFRKLLGGGMRQAGIIAAAGIIALKDMPARLSIDHERAQRLKKGINSTDNFHAGVPVDSNIVIVEYRGSLPIQELVLALARQGLMVNSVGPRALRLVTHYDLTEDDIDRTIEILTKN